MLDVAASPSSPPAAPRSRAADVVATRIEARIASGELADGAYLPGRARADGGPWHQPHGGAGGHCSAR